MDDPGQPQKKPMHLIATPPGRKTRKKAQKKGLTEKTQNQNMCLPRKEGHWNEKYEGTS